jgi:hypothetical protein
MKVNRSDRRERAREARWQERQAKREFLRDAGVREAQAEMWTPPADIVLPEQTAADAAITAYYTDRLNPPEPEPPRSATNEWRTQVEYFTGSQWSRIPPDGDLGPQLKAVTGLSTQARKLLEALNVRVEYSTAQGPFRPERVDELLARVIDRVIPAMKTDIVNLQVTLKDTRERLKFYETQAVNLARELETARAVSRQRIVPVGTRRALFDEG